MTPAPSDAGPSVAMPAFYRLPAVIRITCLGRSTIYRLMAEGQFPRPVQLAPRAVAWRRSDIGDWTATRTVAMAGQHVDGRAVRNRRQRR